jgi:O-antigen/teichoic acid export membrane protein
LYLNIANIIKTLAVVILAISGSISVGVVIFIFGFVGPAVFFLLLLIEKKEVFFILAKSEVRKEDFRFNYALTYFIASQFYNLGLRMDLFLLSYFRPKAEVGYYGLAQKIILTIITTIVSITQVLSPGFSNAKTKGEIKHQLKHCFLYLMIPSGLFFLLFLTPDQVFFLFFTPKFAQTAHIARMLALPYIVNAVASAPMLFLLYTVKKPSYILIANICAFLVISIGCYLAIPIYKTNAPPYIIMVAFVLTGLIESLAAWYEYSKLRLSPNG